MGTRRFIFGAFTDAEMAQEYVDSSVCLTNVEIHLVQYQDWWNEKFVAIKKPKDLKNNLYIHRIEKKYPGNTGKLKDILKVVKSLDITDQDWCFFTDVHDVRFQADIWDMPVTIGLLVAYEGRTFGDIDYWKSILPADMWEWRAYNCGVYGMRGDLFLRYLQAVTTEYQRMVGWRNTFDGTMMGSEFPFGAEKLRDMIRNNVGKFFNDISDTYYFNRFVHGLHPVESMSFGCYNFLVESGVARISRGRLVGPEDSVYSIAHFNGRVEGGPCQKQ